VPLPPNDLLIFDLLDDEALHVPMLLSVLVLVDQLYVFQQLRVQRVDVVLRAYKVWINECLLGAYRS
jgi:hypothetical protein